MESSGDSSEDLWRKSLYPSPSEVEKTFSFFTGVESEGLDEYGLGLFADDQNKKVDVPDDINDNGYGPEQANHLISHSKIIAPVRTRRITKTEVDAQVTHQLKLQIQGLSLDHKGISVSTRPETDIKSYSFRNREMQNTTTRRDPQEKLALLKEPHLKSERNTSKSFKLDELRSKKRHQRKEDESRKHTRKAPLRTKGFEPYFHYVKCWGCSRCLKAPLKASLISCPVCRVLTPTSSRKIQLPV